MTRLDQALVDRGLAVSREQAQRAVLAGLVEIDGVRAAKPGMSVQPNRTITLRAVERYVSRGGAKLEHALREFALDPQGQTALDLGASTGGFTDCLLQHGAVRVYAVDVGRGQLAWRLRQDERVVVMESTNARYLTPDRFPAPFQQVDLVVIDCSFISLRLILPAAADLLRPGGWIVALVKPQFEAGKAEADRGRGVITDPKIHREVLERLREFADGFAALRWHRVVESPVLGPAGNREFLALIEKLQGGAV